MPEKRSRITIIIDILETIQEFELPASRIAEYANMPYDRLKPILEDLEKKGFVKSRKEGRSMVYMVTSEGRKALVKLKEAYHILKSMGLEK